MTGGTSRAERAAVHRRNVGQPFWHRAVHVAGIAGADAGQDLGSARNREPDAERHDQGLSLEAEAQEARDRADTGPQPENDQHGQPVGQALDAEQIGQRNVGRSDDERNRQVQAAEQHDQGLAQASEAEERGEHQHRLEIDRREEPVDNERPDDGEPDQDRHADIRALVGRHISVQRDGKPQQNGQDDRGEHVSRREEPVDGRRQNQEQGDHEDNSRQYRPAAVEQVSQEAASFVAPVPHVRRPGLRRLLLRAFQTDCVLTVDPADGEVMPAPQHKCDSCRSEEDDLLQRRILDHAKNRSRAGDRHRKDETEPLVEEMRRAGHRPLPAAMWARPPTSRLMAGDRRPPR